MTAWLEQQEVTQARPRLMRLAYRMLGSLADAEDVVQEAWLAGLALPVPPDRPEAWLARVVTTRAIDLLRRQKRQRAAYVGCWLPEPWMDAGTNTPATVEPEVDLSMAVMRVLDRLSPLERAAFLLHDLFGLSFEEIGQTLGRSSVTCRKLASRARGQLQAERPRFPARPEDIARLTALIEACVRSGDTAALAAGLADDVELVSDGGAKVAAARRMLSGPAEVAGFLAGILGQIAPGTAIVSRQANGVTALQFAEPGAPDSLVFFDLTPDGQLSGIYIQRNPDKLTALRLKGNQVHSLLE